MEESRRVGAFVAARRVGERKIAGRFDFQISARSVPSLGTGRFDSIPVVSVQTCTESRQERKARRNSLLQILSAWASREKERGGGSGSDRNTGVFLGSRDCMQIICIGIFGSAPFRALGVRQRRKVKKKGKFASAWE